MNFASKEHTNNEYNKSINLAIDYIHSHLGECINLKTVAGAAMISEFHFCRIFKAYIGEPIGEYITRLRMERIAHLLQISDTSLADIAEKTGYQTQQSLSKAFKKHFGITPSAFRHLNTYLTAKLPKPRHTTMQLNPQIVELEPKHLLYLRIIAKYGTTPDYKRAWSQLISYAHTKHLINENSEYIGISFDDPNITEEKKCRFYACVSTDKKIKAEAAFGTFTIEEGKFARFIHKGAYSGLNDLYQAIYAAWVPDNYDKIRNSNSFEKYLNSPDKVKEDDLLTEIYIPIE
ncbi:MAG: AraC family transcriptional regulator [Draconibacterium sp.]|nr:MAG: AraC family transcriptional regulator [Draconibacterium sp.]